MRGAVWSKDRRPVQLVVLPAFGRPARLVWHKRRRSCPEPGREVGSFTETAEWLAARDQAWLDAINWATLALSGPWRLAFTTMLPNAIQVAGPFHRVKLANQRLDEVRQLTRTISRWRRQIPAWHQAHVSNGPTEVANNLIKVVKRITFAFTSFRNYQIRTLLYTGRPNWGLLPTITPTSP